MKPEPREPRFKRRTIVVHGNTPVILQILKIRHNPETGYPEYFVRYYNGFFGGDWVAEIGLRLYP